MMVRFSLHSNVGYRALAGAVVALLAVALTMLAARAAFADDADGGTSGVSQLPIEERVRDVISSCADGLLAGWEVSDREAFYESDMLLIDDGSCVWLAFDMYRAGSTKGADTFLQRLEQHVTEAYAGDDHGLDAYSPTTWARTAIVAGTMGANPSAFGTNASGEPANLLSDGLYNWSYTDNVSDQGSNALVYALQAIYAVRAKVPADAKYSAQDMLDELLECQAEDGSFALSPGSFTGSVDLTGMALSAIAPYRDTPAVAEAVDEAINYLSAQQMENGGFAAEGEATSESCSMAIVGLSACGVNVATDTRFTKEDGSLLEALLAFRKADGTFAHMLDGLADETVRDLPTEQAFRALLAYEELQHGGDGNVYTSDVSLNLLDSVGADRSEGQVDGETLGRGSTDLMDVTKWYPYVISTGVGAAGALVVVAILWGVGRIRRKARR